MKTKKKEKVKEKKKPSLAAGVTKSVHGGKSRNRECPISTLLRSRDQETARKPNKSRVEGDSHNTSNDNSTNDKRVVSDQLHEWLSPKLRARPVFLSEAQVRHGLLIYIIDRSRARDSGLAQRTSDANRKGKRHCAGYTETRVSKEGKIVSSIPICVKIRPAVVVSKAATHYSVCRLYTYNDNGLEGKSEDERDEHVGIHDHRKEDPPKAQYGRYPLLTSTLADFMEPLKSTSFIKFSESLDVGYGVDEVVVYGCLTDADTERLRSLHYESQTKRATTKLRKEDYSSTHISTFFLSSQTQDQEKDERDEEEVHDEDQEHDEEGPVEEQDEKKTGMTTGVARMKLQRSHEAYSSGNKDSGAAEAQQVQDPHDPALSSSDMHGTQNHAAAFPQAKDIILGQDTRTRGVKRTTGECSGALDDGQTADQGSDATLPMPKRRALYVRDEKRTGDEATDHGTKETSSFWRGGWIQRALARVIPQSNDSGLD